jgi:hypothetical protein
MEAPPLSGNVFDYVAANAPNYNQQGVATAWDGVRYFWSVVAQQGIADLDAITLSQGVLI